MTDQPSTQEARGYECRCGSPMPPPQFRTQGWECGRCGRYFGLDNMGFWTEVRGPR